MRRCILHLVQAAGITNIIFSCGSCVPDLISAFVLCARRSGGMSRYEAVITYSVGEGVDVYDLKQGTHLRGFASAADGSLANALLDDEYVVVSQRDKPGVQV